MHTRAARRFRTAAFSLVCLLVAACHRVNDDTYAKIHDGMTL